MRKLILTVAVVAMATIASAASVTWKTSTTGKLYEAGTTTLVASSTAYLFENSGTTALSALVEAFAAGTDITGLTSLATASVANGVISGGAVAGYETPGDSVNAYIAVLFDDMLYVSDAKDLVVPGTGNQAVQFALKTSSQAAALDASAGYTGAGWYQTAAVPEPTSGLLVLLGMAGLALRRRRA